MYRVGKLNDMEEDLEFHATHLNAVIIAEEMSGASDDAIGIWREFYERGEPMQLELEAIYFRGIGYT